jgi:hypothetical protein
MTHVDALESLLRQAAIALLAAALAVLATAHPATGWERPDLSAAGPWDTRWQLSVSDRLRGEFADWFEAAAPNDDQRYDFLGNRFQLGIGVTRGIVSGFVQYQHTQLVNVPGSATGVGSVYFANTRQHF